MKTCSKCNMRLDVHSECPLCHTDLTKIPYFKGECEGYKLNKYFFIFIYKYAKFFIACFIACMVIFIINLPVLSWEYIVSLVLLTACFLETFFPKGVMKWSSWKYTEDYLESTAKFAKYFSGVFAVIVALLVPIAEKS